MAGLCAAASPAPAASPDAGRPGFSWVIPRSLGALDVPGETWAEGIPVHLHAVRSAERPEIILGDFLHAARRAGLYVPPPEELPESSSLAKLTAYDPKTKIAHTVLLQPEPDGSCAVIMMDADLGRREPAVAAAFAPLPPAATRPLVTHAEGASTIAFEVPADPLAFYRSALPRAGFRAESAEANVYRRGAEELSIHASPPAPPETFWNVVVIRRSLESDGVVPPR